MVFYYAAVHIFHFPPALIGSFRNIVEEPAEAAIEMIGWWTIVRG